MGRKRDSGDGLPEYVYLRGGRYRLRYPIGTYSNGQVKFCQESFDTLLECLTRRSHVIKEDGTPRRVNDLIDSYLGSEWFNKLRSRTKSDYLKHLDTIRKVMGHWPVKAVTTQTVYQVKSKRGQTSQVQANRLLSVIRVLFEHGRETGAIEHNPAAKVRRYTEKPRDRYVTDEEFALVYNFAPKSVKLAMVLSSITGLDQSTILNLRFEQFTDDGLIATRRKTGKKLCFSWSEMLHWCHDYARNMSPRLRGIVVCNLQGKQYTTNGFRSVWHRAMGKAVAQGMERYTFHDLRAKAGSDSRDWRLLGHSDRKTFERIYNRLPIQVNPVK